MAGSECPASLTIAAYAEMLFGDFDYDDPMAETPRNYVDEWEELIPKQPCTAIVPFQFPVEENLGDNDVAEAVDNHEQVPVMTMGSVDGHDAVENDEELRLLTMGSVDNVVVDEEKLRLLIKELKEVIKQEVKTVKENEEFHILNPTPSKIYVPSKTEPPLPESPLKCEKKKGKRVKAPLIERTNQPIYLHTDSDIALFMELEKKRMKAPLVGQKNTSFHLSEESLAVAMDLEKSNNMWEYSFAERLKGWRIDRKMRLSSVMFDNSFEHEMSGQKFRSANEVIDFILHEAYPIKQHNANKAIV